MGNPPGGRPLQRCARAVSAFAVCASAGKNDSTASSCKVTSTGVPKIVVVLMKLSTPSGVTSWKGTITLESSTPATGASWLHLRRRVGRQFVVQRRQRGIAGGGDLLLQPLEQVAAPLRQVGDPRGQAVRVQAEPEHVDRRLEQVRGRAGHQHRHQRVVRHQVPVAVDRQRREGLMALEHQVDRPPRRRQGRVVERALRGTSARSRPPPAARCARAAARPAARPAAAPSRGWAAARPVSTKLRWRVDTSASWARSSWLRRRCWRQWRRWAPNGSAAVGGALDVCMATS